MTWTTTFRSDTGMTLPGPPRLRWLRGAAAVLGLTVAVAASAQSDGSQAPGFFLRVSAHQQQHRDVSLTDNLPSGTGSWFGYGTPGNQFGFVIPGNPDPGSRHPHSSRSGGGLAFGYRASPLLRFELAVDRTSGSTIRFSYPALTGPPGDFGSFKVSSVQTMGNIYFDVAPLMPAGALGPVRPYLMAGAGRSRNSNGDYLCTSLNACTALSYANAAAQNSRAWQTGLGLVWDVTPGLALDFGYRYVDMGLTRGADVFAPNAAWGLNGRLTAHRFSVGVIIPISVR